MWKQISKNKRNSFFVFLAMSLLLFVVGGALGLSYAQTFENMLFSAVLTMLIYWLMIFFGKRKSMPISVGANLKKCTKMTNSKLYNVVEEMSVAAGIGGSIPEIYIMDTPIPNAFASGFSPKKSCICVTTGLLELCNRDELQGVIAHEISHIVNRDTTYLLYASIVVSMITTMARMFARSSGRRSRSSSGGHPAIFLIILIVMILAPILAHMFYFLLSRNREYLADACAVQYTRYPAGLASALNKISGNIVSLDSELTGKSVFKDHPFFKASCIIPAVASSKDGWFSTHPSTFNRIKVLMSMTNGADFDSYNRAYSAVTHKSPIIPQADVSSCEKTPIRVGEPMVGLVALNGGVLTPEIKKIEQEEKVERRRETEDMMWRYEGYSFIKCACETTLKCPPSFKGKEIECPHCKSKHVVK